MVTMVAQQFESLPSQDHFDAHMSRIDQRFERMDKRLKKQFNATGVRLTNLELLKSHVNIHTWMLGLIIIVLAVPQLQRWFAVV